MVPNAILFSLKIGVWGRYNRDMERNLRGADKERKGDKMFGFGKKKEAEKSRVTVCKEEEKKELLEMKNIRLDCKSKGKDEVIREVGQMLCDSGYVDEGYIEGMLKRELTFATNIGNGIALPHGVEEAKKEIRRSGIAVMIFPEGTDWGGELVKLVIGIAGAGDEHLEILSTIAECLSNPADVERLVSCTKEEIYDTFTGKGNER